MFNLNIFFDQVSARSFWASLVAVFLLTSCNGTEQDGTENKATTTHVDERKTEPPALGEDRASIDVKRVVAGEKTTFEVLYTVGEAGLPVNGAVSVGFHHGSNWSVQGYDSTRPNYLEAIRSDTGKSMLITKGNTAKMFPNDLPEIFSPRIFNQVLIAEVIDEPMEPGDKIRFTFGAGEHAQRVQVNVDLQHQILVASDHDGDGVFTRVWDDLIFSVEPAPASFLTASGPAQVKVGEPFELLIRADDPFINIATDFTQAISVRDESGNIVDDNVILKDGIATISIVIDAPGPQRFRLESKDGLITGRSDPIRVLKTFPKYRIYWGDIHGHTGFSDGLGRSRDDYFEFGRDVAGLDVLALTDHGHAEWGPLQKAVQKYYDPGKFVTILAQEAGAGPDHMNIYLRADDVNHIEEWTRDYKRFQEIVLTQYNSGPTPAALTGPHHFAYNRGERGDPLYPFKHWDTRVARFVEVYSSHGTSEFLGNPRALPGENIDRSKYMQWGLAQGKRFGVIGSSDSHNSKPGHSNWSRFPNGLAAFLATEKEREAVWDSFWNYRVYGTSFDRIYMELTANDLPMGSELGNPKSVVFDGYIIGKTDVLQATLLRDNEAIQTFSTKTGLIEFSVTDKPTAGDHSYYLRVEQDNGERAWSSPFWIGAAPQ